MQMAEKHLKMFKILYHQDGMWGGTQDILYEKKLFSKMGKVI